MKPYCLCYIILLFSLLVGAQYADDECEECVDCEECKESEECVECEECEECESEEFQPGRQDHEVHDRFSEEPNIVHDHANMEDTGSMKQKVLDMHNEFRRKLKKGGVSDLAWDKSLEELGQKMADKCEWGYLYESEVKSGGYGNIGQNIAYSRTVEQDFEKWTDQREEPRHYNQVSVRETKKSG
ncbi:unnamed protein product [Hymenolepis diminuta]|uniref:SCP domain-containing protein n=1 Tax=Hymenolepis diminuta TaxID=6216 RepID=A0A564YQW4_HYMDI|nr:unnamed protein product [Hymenolepis diminuta]